MQIEDRRQRDRRYTDRRELHDEPALIDRLLEGWASWAHSDGIDLRPKCAGDLWQIQTIIDGTTYVVRLPDDQFVSIDREIARLPIRLKMIVFLEYREQGTVNAKARRLGLGRLAYRMRLNGAQWALYTALRPILKVLT
jgi:hypothetical protein